MSGSFLARTGSSSLASVSSRRHTKRVGAWQKAGPSWEVLFSLKVPPWCPRPGRAGIVFCLLWGLGGPRLWLWPAYCGSLPRGSQPVASSSGALATRALGRPSHAAPPHEAPGNRGSACDLREHGQSLTVVFLSLTFLPAFFPLTSVKYRPSASCCASS